MDQTDSVLHIFDQLRKKATEKIVPEPVRRAIEKSAHRSKTYAKTASSAFLDGYIDKALQLLTKAINILPSAELYAKRSVVHLTLSNHQLAAGDGTCAIGMDRSFPSGYLCRALALIYLGEYDIALKDLSKLRNCLSNSKRCNALYISCRNMYRDRGIIEPFEIPQDISENAVDEEYSVFVDKKVNSVIQELSSSGIVESSKLNEEFVGKVIETYKHGIFHLPQKQIFIVLKSVLDQLKDTSNIVSIDITEKQKLTIVGDLRGNFDNLLSIFRHNHSPQFGRPYLFNGNIIGEFKMSLPCIVIILCMKILFPEDVYIARGHEESLERCEVNGFENEVLTVYDEDVMKGFTEVFNWLPVAHILNNSILVVHGGLFEDENISLADVQEIKRHYQPPDSGPLCDILYSDPFNREGISKENHPQGVWFGPDVTQQFCIKHGINYIIRSHSSTKPSGYEVQSHRHCVTINSSTPFATYLTIMGDTSTYEVLNGRKEKRFPKNCGCWVVCNCHKSNGTKEDPLNDNNASLKLDLLPAPCDTSSQLNKTPSSSQMSSRSRQKFNLRVSTSIKSTGSLQRTISGLGSLSTLETTISSLGSQSTLKTSKSSRTYQQTLSKQFNDEENKSMKKMSQTSDFIGNTSNQYAKISAIGAVSHSELDSQIAEGAISSWVEMELEGEYKEEIFKNKQLQVTKVSEIISTTSLTESFRQSTNTPVQVIDQQRESEMTLTTQSGLRGKSDDIPMKNQRSTSAMDLVDRSMSRSAHWLTVDPSNRSPSHTHSVDEDEGEVEALE